MYQLVGLALEAFSAPRCVQQGSLHGVRGSAHAAMGRCLREYCHRERCIRDPVDMIIKAYRLLVFDGIRIFGDADSAPLRSHGNPNNRRLPASSSRLPPDAETRSSAQPCPEGWF